MYKNQPIGQTKFQNSFWKCAIFAKEKSQLGADKILVTGTMKVE
jgi:hypothetical protein